MSHRKPSLGVCGTFGCAVVIPSMDAKWSSVAVMNGRVHGERLLPAYDCASGHQFDDAGNLLSVRCPHHGGLGFPREAMPGATVLM